METKTIVQSVTFEDVKPDYIYQMLTDEAIQSEFADSPCKIEAKEGGSFSCYGDGLVGEFVELKAPERIVMKWQADSQKWPKKHYSSLTFTISEEHGNTLLEMIHEHVPADEYDAIDAGWRRYYWEPMKEYIGRHR